MVNIHSFEWCFKDIRLVDISIYSILSVPSIGILQTLSTHLFLQDQNMTINIHVVGLFGTQLSPLNQNTIYKSFINVHYIRPTTPTNYLQMASPPFSI